MLTNAYLLAKIGADTAENEQHFAEILPIGRCVGVLVALEDRERVDRGLKIASYAPSARRGAIGRGPRGRRSALRRGRKRRGTAMAGSFASTEALVAALLQVHAGAGSFFGGACSVNIGRKFQKLK